MFHMNRTVGGATSQRGEIYGWPANGLVYRFRDADLEQTRDAEAAAAVSISSQM